MSTHELNGIAGEPGENCDSLPPASPESPYVFKHAPPKPDGDPWEILLKPELEADTERCNAWKEEVQTLLIFAGLFSAVVTAFVIESYKFLQKDPNNAIIGLLFIIANSLNSTSPLPPSVNLASIATPFSQTPSSVRINVFWFISLILSLTTVLVGTISLQWLREHQSYPGVSSKEKLAIFHMRSEALDVWCVPQIFSALPVLLQAALALFLAGLIDFVLPLGRKLTIPVSVIIGLTLLFLVATTVLPTFQGFFFLTGFYPYRKPPTPCAFKSPQSRIFLTIFALPIRALSSVIFWVYIHLHLKHSTNSIFRRHAPLPYLRALLRQKTWPNLDRGWLRVRDAYHQCILDRDPELYFHRREWNAFFPLSDITQCLVKTAQEHPTAKHTEAYLGAAVHCFQELSASIWTGPERLGRIHTNRLRKDRRSKYFEQLYHQSSCSVANYFLHGGVYNYYQIDTGNLKTYLEPTTTQHLFYWDQISSFLALLLQRHGSSALFQYRTELWTQIIFQSNRLVPLISQSRSSHPFTLMGIVRHTYNVIYDHLLPGQNQRYAAVADILAVVFKSAASHHISQDQSMDFVCAHSEMAGAVEQLAFLTYHYFQWAQENASNTSTQQHQQDIGAQFASIFKSVAGYLNKEISNSEQNPEEDTPSVLFYLASVFMWEFLVRNRALVAHQATDSNIGQGLRAFIEALLNYRMWAQASNRKNDVLETRFNPENYPWKDTYSLLERLLHTDRFSSKWWDDLFEQGRLLGFKADEQGTSVAQGTSPESHPDNFSQAISASGTTAANVPASEGDIIDPDEDLQPEPQPESTTCPIPNSDDQNEFIKQQSLRNSLATLSRSLPSSIDPHMTRTAVSDNVAPKTMPRSLLSSGTVIIVPQHAAANVTGDGQRQLQSSGPHLTIEVGSPTNPEQDESVEITGSGGEASQD